MPCYQEITVSAELKVADLALLKKAVASLGYNVADSVLKENFYAYHKSNGKNLDYINGSIKIYGGTDKDINAIKKAYAAAVVEQTAKKYGWVTKKQQDNKYILQRR